MILKDISFKTPQENILYDEVLLYLAERNQIGEVLRFWESSEYFVVLGRIGKEEEDVKIDNVCKDQIPVVRRFSGGGTVVQGKGCLNYTLVLSKEHDPQIADLRRSYKIICGHIIEALKQLGIDSEFCPTSDIALVADQKKISGNAQKRSKKFILHHGTILYDFDLNKIEQYLKIPRDVPEYRQKRGHLDFVSNIPVSVDDIKSAIKKVFPIEREENHLYDMEQQCLQEYLNTKNVQLSLCIEQ